MTPRVLPLLLGLEACTLTAPSLRTIPPTNPRVQFAELAWSVVSRGRCQPSKLGLTYAVISARECETATGIRCAGYWDGNFLRVLIVDRYVSSPCYDWILMHELGHACGLGHAASPTDIMYRHLPRECIIDD